MGLHHQVIPLFLTLFPYITGYQVTGHQPPGHQPPFYLLHSYPSQYIRSSSSLNTELGSVMKFGANRKLGHSDSGLHCSRIHDQTHQHGRPGMYRQMARTDPRSNQPLGPTADLIQIKYFNTTHASI
eukprot:TRINITY_DN10197_c0_g1_i1.p1 TRINITY_DN10197_c0_g1~~TRINITY_DN10197_c0_g1_i1.p1  ORF type:complete len:127 (+),score=5.07 TRINITY_DN10197_c0_g1_i1:327-707(+)